MPVEYKDWFNFKSEYQTALYKGTNGVSLNYFQIKNQSELEKNYINNFKFEIAPDIIRFVMITGQGGEISPHIDHGIRVALNFYIQTSNLDETIFYEKNNENIPAFKYNETKNESNIYNKADLIIKETFSSTDDSMFLLDVTKIHSVKKSSKSPRIFLAFIWKNNTFGEILNLITGKQCLDENISYKYRYN